MNRFTIFHIDGTAAAAPNVFDSKEAAWDEASARIFASEATATPLGNGEFFVKDEHGNEYGVGETPDSLHVWIRPATATLTRIKKSVEFIGVSDVRVRSIHYQWGGPADPDFGNVELYIDGRWVRSRIFEEFVEIVHAQAAPAPFAPLRVVAAAPVVAISKNSLLPKRRGLNPNIM
jgi:hypothetical protein